MKMLLEMMGNIRKAQHRILGLTVLASILLMFYQFSPRLERDEVKVAVPAIIASWPHWVADKKGFYMKEGLKIAEIELNSSPEMIRALQRREVDVLPAVSLVDVAFPEGVTTREPVIFSHSRMKKSPPFEALMVINNSDITELKKLKGKTIGVYPGGSSEKAIRHLLNIQTSSGSIVTDEIKFKEIDVAALHETLMSDNNNTMITDAFGDVQCLHIYEPYLTLMKDTGGVAMLPLDETDSPEHSIYVFLKAPAIGVSVFSQEFSKRKGGGVEKRYLSAWDKAVQFIQDEPDEAKGILAQYMEIPKDKSWEKVWVRATKSDEYVLDDVKKTVEVLREIEKIAPTAVSLKPARLIHMPEFKTKQNNNTK